MSSNGHEPATKDNCPLEPYRCKRCGSTDWAKHEGYHADHDLPVKHGDKVLIRAGAEIRTTLPTSDKNRIVNARKRWVKVHHMLGGRSDSVGYDYEKREPIYQHLEGPSIRWAGTGGYWHEVKLDDVLEVKRA